MLEAGHARIGMDHFALPDGEKARAPAQRRLTRNFMGYTVRKGSDMIGAGVSAFADVRGSYAQNAKKLPADYAALEAGRIPVERGDRPSRNDRIRLQVIARLMRSFAVGEAEIEESSGICFHRDFHAELAELRAPDGLLASGFVEMLPDRIEKLFSSLAPAAPSSVTRLQSLAPKVILVPGVHSDSRASTCSSISVSPYDTGSGPLPVEFDLASLSVIGS